MPALLTKKIGFKIYRYFRKEANHYLDELENKVQKAPKTTYRFFAFTMTKIINQNSKPFKTCENISNLIF